MSNFLKNFDTFRLENTLKGELFKYNWSVLSIQWYQFRVAIFIYNRFILSKFIKQNVFKHYKKYKNIKKLAEKFNLNSLFTRLILKRIRNLSVIKVNNFKFVQFFFLLLFWKKLKLNTIMCVIIQLKYFNWIKIILMFESFFTYKKIKNNYRFYKNNKLVLKKKFYKINGFLYFKVLTVFTESLLFNLTNKHIKVSFNSVWNNQGLLFKIPSIKKKENHILKVLFICCFYNNTQIFSDFIAFHLKRNKNHKKFLQQTTLTIEKFWKIKKISLVGMQLRISGKIDGRMRKSKYHYSLGKVQLHSLQTKLNYSMSISHTKFGVISIKFWIINGNKKI